MLRRLLALRFGLFALIVFPEVGGVACSLTEHCG